jgi:hypothetical protein
VHRAELGEVRAQARAREEASVLEARRTIAAAERAARDEAAAAAAAADADAASERVRLAARAEEAERSLAAQRAEIETLRHDVDAANERAREASLSNALDESRLAQVRADLEAAQQRALAQKEVEIDSLNAALRRALEEPAPLPAPAANAERTVHVSRHGSILIGGSGGRGAAAAAAGAAAAVLEEAPGASALKAQLLQQQIELEAQHALESQVRRARVFLSPVYLSEALSEELSAHASACGGNPMRAFTPPQYALTHSRRFPLLLRLSNCRSCSAACTRATSRRRSASINSPLISSKRSARRRTARLRWMRCASPRRA